MRIALGVLGLLLAGSVALGAPRNGFGLAGGLAVHAGQQKFSTDEGASFSSAGFSVAGDAQFGVNDEWSLNPFLQLSWERTGDEDPGTASNGAAGLEVRRWWGTFYGATRLGYYVELYAQGGRTGTGYGPGLGAGLGREEDSGLTWGATFEAMSVGLLGVRAGLRLHLGQRWGAP